MVAFFGYEYEVIPFLACNGTSAVVDLNVLERTQSLSHSNVTTNLVNLLYSGRGVLVN